MSDSKKDVFVDRKYHPTGGGSSVLGSEGATFNQDGVSILEEACIRLGIGATHSRDFNKIINFRNQCQVAFELRVISDADDYINLKVLEHRKYEMGEKLFRDAMSNNKESFQDDEDITQAVEKIAIRAVTNAAIFVGLIEESFEKSREVLANEMKQKVEQAEKEKPN